MLNLITIKRNKDLTIYTEGMNQRMNGNAECVLAWKWNLYKLTACILVYLSLIACYCLLATEKNNHVVLLCIVICRLHNIIIVGMQKCSNKQYIFNCDSIVYNRPIMELNVLWENVK